MNTPHLSQTLRPTLNLLRITFGIVPIVAGLDKFTNYLTHWERYIHPDLVTMLPFTPHTFMIIVGIIEIVAGLIVLIKPAVGGHIVAAWLTLIAVSLIAAANYLDIAVRDLVMAICAFSMARITKIVNSK